MFCLKLVSINSSNYDSNSKNFKYKAIQFFFIMILVILLTANLIFLIYGMFLILTDALDSQKNAEKDRLGKLPVRSSKGMAFLLISFLMLVFVSILNLSI